MIMNSKNATCILQQLKLIQCPKVLFIKTGGCAFNIGKIRINDPVLNSMASLLSFWKLETLKYLLHMLHHVAIYR